jgi:hypothetical protein
LAQGNEQEIEVEEELELLVKHHWDETDDRVLLIAGDVCRVNVGSVDCQEQGGFSLFLERIENLGRTHTAASKGYCPRTIGRFDLFPSCQRLNQTLQMGELISSPEAIRHEQKSHSLAVEHDQQLRYCPPMLHPHQHSIEAGVLALRFRD